jgi:hypothetical protein
MIKHQQAFYAIVLELPLATRRRYETQIKMLQDLLGDDTDVFVDRRGKHWAERRVAPMLRVDVRGKGTNDMTYEEASQFVCRTTKQIQTALSIGRGAAYFRVGDDIITVQKL